MIYLGINGKTNEASAAMGLTNLEDIEKFIATNRRNCMEYRRCLAGIPGVTLLPYDETEEKARRTACLPTGTAVRRQDVRAICGIIRLALESADALRHQLALTN